MSSYACEPERGSEPGVGWNWAITMARHVDATVMTRSNNREVIERYLETDQGVEAVPHFTYYDLPSPFLWLKRKRLMTSKVYYCLWQIGLAWKMRKARKGFDVIHHVTFNVFTCPGFWWGGKDAVVLGPLGGGIQVSDSYMPLFREKAKGQKLRNFLVRGWRFIPSVRMSLRRADAILCANVDTYDLLKREYPEKTSVHLETGIDPECEEDLRCSEEESGVSTDRGYTQFLIVGSIEPRKGWELALGAVNELSKSDRCERIRLTFVGDGPDVKLAQDRVSELRIETFVTFAGRQPHDMTKQMIKEADVLLFPSVRDTSGNVVLEAMSYGKPVICLNHQGVAEMTSDACAIRIEPTGIEATYREMAAAMFKLSEDQELRSEMGACGYRRITERFTWKSKGEHMLNIYQDLVDKL